MTSEAAITPDPAPTLHARISSRLMEEHRLGTSLKTDSQVLATRGPTGEMDLFYTGAKAGSELDRIYNLQRDPASSTGWRHTDLQAPFQPVRLAAGVDPADGRHVVFSQALNDAAPDLYYAREAADGSWSGWSRVPRSDDVPPRCSVRAMAAETVAGKLELYLVLGNAPGTPYRPLALWRVRWSDEKPEWRRLGQVDVPFVKYARTAAHGEGVLAVRDSAADPDRADLVLFPAGGGSAVTVAAGVPLRKVSVEEAADGCSVVFLYTDQGVGIEPGIHFVDLHEAAPRAVPLPGTEGLRCRQILAVDAGRIPLTLYALGEDGMLRAIRQRPASGNGGEAGWEPPMPLGFRYSWIAGGKSEDEYPTLFGVTAGGEAAGALECICKSPPVEGEDVAPGWRRFSVDLPVERVQTVPCYATELTVLDSAGSPQPLCPVRLSATELAEVRINGQAVLLSPTRSVDLATDAAGRIALVTPTASLNVGKWLVSFPGAANDGRAQVVDLNGHEYQRLRGVSVDGVKALLPEAKKAQAADVHAALRRVTSLVGTPVRGPRFLGADGTGIHRPLRSAASRGPAWEFAVENGETTFRTLTRAEARERRLRVTGGNATVAGLLEWFADAAQAVANGIATAFRCIVDGVKAVIEVVIAGIRYVYEGVVRFVEQAFQVAESILHSVGVFFARIFDFFGALLRDFQRDIWNTKLVLEKAADQAVTALIGLAEAGKSHSAGFFRQLKRQVDDGFETLLAAVGSQTFDYGLLYPRPSYALRSGESLQSTLEDASAHAGFVSRALLAPGGDPEGEFSITTELKDALERFRVKAEAGLTDGFRQAVAALEALLTSTARSPEELFRLLLAAVVRVAKAGADAAIDIADGLVQLFLDTVILLLKAFRSMVLQQPLRSPLLQALYDLVNPNPTKEPLTVGGLTALLLAAPIAVGARVLTGRSPFTPAMVRAALRPGDSLPLFGAPPAGDTGDRAFADRFEQARLFAAGIAKVFPWSVLDLGADVVEPGPGPTPLKGRVRGWMSGAGFSFFIGVLTTPSSIGSWSTDLDRARNVNWLFSLLPSAWGTICTLIGVPTRANPVACTVLALLGFVGFCGSLAYLIVEWATVKWSPRTMFITLPSRLPTMVKPLRFVQGPPRPFALAALYATDVVVDVGTGIGLVWANWPTAARSRPRPSLAAAGAAAAAPA